MLPFTDAGYSIFFSVLDLMFPAPCLGCAGARGPLCPPCVRQLVTRPHQARVRLPFPVLAGFEYTGLPRTLLVGYKERGQRRLRPVLAAALVTAARRALVERDRRGPPASAIGGAAVLIPMPTSAAARRRRGGDPVGVLGASAARRLRSEGHDVRVLPALRFTRTVADSVGLTAEQRAANLDGAFTVPRRVADRLRRAAALGARIVLLDDVCTTGSTFREAARSLAAHGVTVEAAAVVAATPRRVG